MAVLYSAQKHSEGGDDDDWDGNFCKQRRWRPSPPAWASAAPCYATRRPPNMPRWRSRSSRSIRFGRNRCPTKGCSAWPSGIGRCPGQRLDGPPQQPDAAQQRKRRRAQSADRGVLSWRAAGARVQSGRRHHPRMGRTRRRLRMAGIDARRLCRPQGQCLARRQWRKGCANPQIQPGRQVLAAVRPSGQECRQQRYRELRACGADLRRSEDQ